MANNLGKPVESTQGTDRLLHSLRELILGARQKALRAVDAVQVQTCWEIGRHLVEFEEGARLVQSTAPGFSQSWLRL